jgi:hypothetical protein
MKKYLLLVLSLSFASWHSGAQEKKHKPKTAKANNTHNPPVKPNTPAELPPPIQPGSDGIPVKPLVGAAAPLPIEVQRELDAQKKNPKGKKTLRIQTPPPLPAPLPAPGNAPQALPTNANAPQPRVIAQGEPLSPPTPNNAPPTQPTPQGQPLPPAPAGKKGKVNKSKGTTATPAPLAPPIASAQLQKPKNIPPPRPLPGNAPPPPQKLIYDHPMVLDSNAGKFAFTEETHTYGTVPEGPVAECDFEFVNVGKKPITIIEAHGSCGCTVPQYSKDPVLPGKKGSIHVIYTTLNHPGIINKEVVITSTAQQSPFTLHIKGQVQEKAK